MTHQSRFMTALLSPELACPEGLASVNGVDPTLRFAVHRNNVLSALVQALADTCPVVRALVGAEFFHAMALAFVRTQPPQSPLLNSYGKGFADFIEDFAPARELPYLAPMAGLEWARVSSYHAADAAPLARTQLAAQLADPQQLARLILQLHPSVRVIRSPYAVVSLWAAHQPGGDLAGLDPYRPEQGLLLRAEQDVLLLPIDLAVATFIQALREEQPLAAAAQMALQQDRQFDLANTLALLLRWELICACSSLT